MNLHGQMPVMISTSHNDLKLQEQKSWFLAQPGIEWILEDSRDLSFPRLHITRKGFSFIVQGNEPLFFHPSMALLRLMNILKGERDRFLESTKIEKGDQFLDATMGLASDSLIASWAAGDIGKVVAIERSPIICALVSRGLIELAHGIIPEVSNPLKMKAWEELKKAAARIQVIYDEHYSFLMKQTSRSFDIIYFDPMFRNTRDQSSSIRPLHRWSNRNPLDLNTIIEASRVARKRVVLKERKSSAEFTRLGFNIYPSGKYSSVDFGIIDVVED